MEAEEGEIFGFNVLAQEGLVSSVNVVSADCAYTSWFSADMLYCLLCVSITYIDQENPSYGGVLLAMRGVMVIHICGWADLFACHW